MSVVLIRCAVCSLVETCGVVYIVKQWEVDIASACFCQSLVSLRWVITVGYEIAVFINGTNFYGRVILCMCEPDRHIFDRFYHFVCQCIVCVSFAYRICCCKVFRIMYDHVHGHKSAVWASADVYAACIDIRVAVYISFDQFHQSCCVFGGSIACILSGTIIHPHRRALCCQNVCSAVKVLLYSIGCQVDYFVS